MKNTLTIAKRELRAYFDSLVAYVVIGLSMLGLGLWMFAVQGFWSVDKASLAQFFASIPYALALIVIPLVTMRALAEEKRSGTLELLITMPVKDSEVILGKYLGALGMVVILLFATLLYPLAMFVWPWHLGALDWGPVGSAYLGLLLFSSAACAIGMLFSSITESQIIAFFLTAAVLLFLLFLGPMIDLFKLTGGAGDAIAFISLHTQFDGFARGVIDTRSIVYFVSIATVCLLLAFRSLESRKWT
jgi:ABC-2 type transport system permease protein